MQQQIPLPLETALRMRIALLEHDLTQLQAKLIQVTAEQQRYESVAVLLAKAQIVLPVPLAQCAFDAERGCLTFDDGLEVTTNHHGAVA